MDKRTYFEENHFVDCVLDTINQSNMATGVHSQEDPLERRSLNTNAFECPNERSENDCKYDSEVYSHIDLGIDDDVTYESAKSHDHVNRVTFDTRSGTGDSIIETDSCSITEEESPLTALPRSEFNCNSTPIAKPPRLTELVKTLFSPRTAENFGHSLTNELPITTDQTESTDDKLGRENNIFLRGLVRNKPSHQCGP